jgi:hypothetical protein
VFAFLIRLAGYVTLVAGLIVGVFDIARSVAAGRIEMAPLGKVLFDLFGERYLLLQPAIERHVSEFAWNSIVLPLTLLPALILLFITGIVLVAIGWRRRPQPLAASV